MAAAAAAAEAADEAAAPSAGPGRAAALLLGDSITEYSFDDGGFGALLAHAYRRKADVVCRGYSGYNSRMALQALPHLLPPLPPLALATVFVGANDAAAPEPFRFGGDADKPPQHVPLAEYEANLAALCARVGARLARPGGIVVLVSPPPVVEASWPDRSNARVREYSAAAARAAAASGALHLDLFARLYDGEGGAFGALLSDGLHLSRAGNARVAQLLLELLAERAPQALPDALPLDLPLWRDAAAQGAAAFAPAALAALRAAPFAMPPRPALAPGEAARAAEREREGGAGAGEGAGAR